MDLIQVLLDINDKLNSIVWGVPAIVTLAAIGITVLVWGRGFQFVKFGLAVKNLLWKGKTGSGEVKPFKMFATVMGATVGVGNIAGVATAIHLGGPGAMFWMWVIALLGMGTKAAEVTLSMFTRTLTPEGRVKGGSMYYIEKVPIIGSALALFFSAAVFLGGLLGIGNMVQANSVAHGAEFIANAFGITDPAQVFNVRLVTGILAAFFTALVVIGGVRRIADASFMLVPFMAAWYIVFGVAGWFLSGGLGDALSKIFTYAFTPQAVGGGAAGYTVYKAIRYGFARGIFSNEAGLGSAPIAYAYSESDHPGRQGFYGVMEVFLDTIVICSITGIMIVSSGVDITKYTGAYLAMEAFSKVYGKWAGVVVGVALALFAYTTLLTWEFYSERAFVYFFSERLKILSERIAVWVIRVLWVISIIPGAIAAAYLGALWDVADTLNGLMMIPNVIALVTLLPTSLYYLRDFSDKYIPSIERRGVTK